MSVEVIESIPTKETNVEHSELKIKSPTNIQNTNLQNNLSHNSVNNNETNNNENLSTLEKIGTTLLEIADFIGEVAAEFLGLTQSKYEYVLQAKRREIRRKKVTFFFQMLVANLTNIYAKFSFVN